MTDQNPTTTFDCVYDVMLNRNQSSPEPFYVDYLMDEGFDMILKNSEKNLLKKLLLQKIKTERIRFTN